MSIARMMKGHELFRSLSFEEVERVSRFSGSKGYDKGEVVFKRDARGSHFFVVVEGRVNLRLPSDDGESSLVVGRMDQGDIFGLSSFLGMERFTTTAQCARPSSVLAVEVEPFRELLDQNPRVGQSVMNMVARVYFSRYIETLRRMHHLLDDLA